FRKCLVGPRERRQFPHHGANIIQLAGPVSLRVTGDDLFDKTGARTRHADDEQRFFAVNAEAGPPREELRPELPQHPVDTGIERSGLEWIAPGVNTVAGLI